jgi:hypothetical protein
MGRNASSDLLIQTPPVVVVVVVALVVLVVDDVTCTFVAGAGFEPWADRFVPTVVPQTRAMARVPTTALDVARDRAPRLHEKLCIPNSSLEIFEKRCLIESPARELPIPVSGCATVSPVAL